MDTPPVTFCLDNDPTLEFHTETLVLGHYHMLSLLEKDPELRPFLSYLVNVSFFLPEIMILLYQPRVAENHHVTQAAITLAAILLP